MLHLVKESSTLYLLQQQNQTNMCAIEINVLNIGRNKMSTKRKANVITMNTCEMGF